MVAVVEKGGVRYGGVSVTTDGDGYPSDMGDILLEEIEDLQTSADCRKEGMRDPVVLHFGRRWTDPSRSPDPTSTPWLPTRFELASGAHVEVELDGARIEVWGTIPFPDGSPPRCEPVLAQYVRRADA